MRNALRPPAVAIALVLLASCAADGDDASTTSTTTASTAVTPSTTTTTTTTSVPPEQLELVVAGARSECEDVDLRTCMVVLHQGETSWSNFYSGIEGFEFTEGVRSTLLVERTHVVDPDADDTGVRYRLIEVLATEPDSDPPSPGDQP